MKITDCRFEELSHTAEIGMRVWAPDARGLFVCAAHALFALVGAVPQDADDSRTAAASTQPFAVHLESLDRESLLVDWLSELVYLYETSGLVCSSADVTHLTPTSLEATVHGRLPVLSPRLHVKAVTYHGLELSEDKSGWTATVYLDI